MKLKFNSNQQYQLDAIQAVINLFEGQPLNKGAYEVSMGKTAGLEFTDKGVANELEFVSLETLAPNIQKVQFENNLSVNTPVQIIENGWHFSVEMETGTGKTYTYIRTIYELNKIYGFKKFIIVVPSVAIREGTLKNLDITHEHFQNIYNSPPINFSVYDSKKLTALRSFATSNSIQVLVINIDSFTKDNNIINQIRETGIKPIEYLQSTRPIVIVDEPQNMNTDIRKRAIDNLNPMCTLRYSATHTNLHNLIYSLNPVQAYDMGLVKQIEVDGITTEDNISSTFIQFVSIEQGKRDIKAKIKIYVNDKNSVKVKTCKCSVGADLYKLSNERDIYKNGFILNSINAEWNEIEFSNGLIMTAGQSQGGLTDEIMKFQIERTVKKHFEKERRYQSKGIKVLSLFFIDRVANYRQYAPDGTTTKGKFAEWFEEIYTRLATNPRYADLYPYHVEQVHNGYFSKDKKGNIKDTRGNTKADDSTYNLIMKDKERLLSPDEPLRFIFSHSALREGWDNPNVFQICTLNESKSDLKKRQEIGRGLRLPVDSTGTRCFDKRINILTVIANETYTDFSKQLQKEIQEETGVNFEGRVKDARKKERVKLTKELTPENCPAFFEIWDKIKQRTRYKVEYDTADLIEEAVEAVRQMPPTTRPIMKSETGRFDISNSGVEATAVASERKVIYEKNYTIPDVYAYIQNKIDITRKTIYEILRQSGRLEELTINPQLFLDNVIIRLRSALNRLMIDGIKYTEIDGSMYEMRMFENEEIETYLSNLFPVTNEDKTLFNYISVDSGIETKFAQDCEIDEKIKFYFKLPKAFKIDTPIGGYNPDWAVIFENDKRIYFVAETKSTTNEDELRPQEKMKIMCGKKHFALFEKDGVRYKVVDEVGKLYQ